ncbi:SDR family NAD(P)-dependent oxidoreductase [Olivibacter sp. SDN3]|uniref:SDR family NAD(P)-dependent oxidoreductase n=1 Tax=Olivibacter sp. SDN3 TaxID=2764720 RepID=UPI001650DF86|nr:SDR family NAD(P)-dependent oxidoreductase [Olivibacter sp. SDN3]QNL47708.1 SDR family NAD(P)-dependent oxidoreductase [Olivibacter sp. SDN3]
MKRLDFRGRWVLVTGASSGLGEEIARQLASIHGANLILLARRKERLESLKKALEYEAKVEVEVVVADLSVTGDVERITDEILKKKTVYAVVLNAGITYLGNHMELSREKFNQMVQINIVSTTYMINVLVRYFEKQQAEGGVMVVSSMAALFPTPYQAVYAGTKGFLLNFVSALSKELTNSRFSFTVFMPGGIATEMTAGDQFNGLRSYLMPVQQVAREGLSAFKRRKSTYIPGFFNRLSSRLSFLLRKDFIIKQTGSAYRKSLEKLTK